MTKSSQQFAYILLFVAAFFVAGADAPIRQTFDDHQFDLPTPRSPEASTTDAQACSSPGNESDTGEPQHGSSGTSSGGSSPGTGGDSEHSGEHSDGTSGSDSEAESRDESASSAEHGGDGDGTSAEHGDQGGSDGTGAEHGDEGGGGGTRAISGDGTSAGSGEPENTDQYGGTGGSQEANAWDDDSTAESEVDTSNVGKGIKSSTKPPLIDIPEPEFDIPDFTFPTPDWATIVPVLWGLLAFFLLGIIGILLARIIGSFSPREEEEEKKSILDDLRAQAGGESHATSAARQDYVAATHAMLLEIFETLEPSLPIIARPATTSREIVAHIRNRALAKSVGSLVAVVEYSRFAGRAMDEATYQEALSAYQEARNDLRDES